MNINKQHTILVVDDTDTNVETLLELLEDKYDTLATLSGEDALDIVQEEQVDLILLDIMMPNMDGFEVCRRLKNNQNTKDIPVIFITAKTDDTSIEEAYELGGVDYITKPFRAIEVLSKINMHLTLKDNKTKMQNTLDNKTQLINELLDIGISLTSENDFNILLEKIMLGCKKFSNADAGTIYLISKDGKYLEFVIVHTDQLDIKMGGSGEKLIWPPLNLYDQDGKPNNHMVAVKCALESKLFNFEDVYHVKEFNFDGTKVFDQSTNYKTQSMLVVPMLNRDKDVIGVIQLINKKDDNGNIIKFKNADEILISSMSSLGAVSIHNHQLVENLENLLETFIKTIVDTLEEKSQYTEHHVLRVAQIVKLISRAINDDDTIFKDIHFSDDELQELDMAALLHDIGKIITPEAVVDKATRLETIFDRINHIAVKFDILRRDRYIQYIQNLSKNEDKNIEYDKYLNDIKSIDEDEEFIKYCNTASFLTDDDIARIKQIANNKITLNNKEQNFLTENELFNLSIVKGTLTNQEREIINNHVKVSYKMLKNLPFPKKYRHIPKLAGSHHKFVDGKSGYAADELMGIPLNLKEKILAVADVFEALTSPERPYKKPYTLSETFKIISFMVQDGQLDKDIIKFMLNSKIYMNFAKNYLNQTQIDDVDIDIS
jgi:response regulator RpfG family c-di-GMP phosphodiesterase